MAVASKAAILTSLFVLACNGGGSDWKLFVGPHEGELDGILRLRKAGHWLWPDDCSNSVPASRSSLVAAVLHLAELRPVSEFS